MTVVVYSKYFNVILSYCYVNQLILKYFLIENVD